MISRVTKARCVGSETCCNLCLLRNVPVPPRKLRSGKPASHSRIRLSTPRSATISRSARTCALLIGVFQCLHSTIHTTSNPTWCDLTYTSIACFVRTLARCGWLWLQVRCSGRTRPLPLGIPARLLPYLKSFRAIVRGRASGAVGRRTSQAARGPLGVGSRPSCAGVRELALLARRLCIVGLLRA